MKKLVINGGYPLNGSIKISGAKNAALPMMTASILSDHNIVLNGVPDLADVKTMITLLESMGIETNKNHKSSLTLNASGIDSRFASYELVKTMRASIMVLGPLLAKYGEQKSLYLEVVLLELDRLISIYRLEKLGARIEIKDGYLLASADRLIGSLYRFPKKSVTGTSNIFTSATLAEGETKIVNSACEPEIVQLGELLNAMGARIEGLGEDCITIQGVENLVGAKIEIIPDRIEAITMIIAGIITQGEIEIENINPSHLDEPIELIRQCGAMLEISERSLFVKGPDQILPISFETEAYPGIPTDIQAQLMVLNTIANGDSKITETIFENRFMHVLELKRMGANIGIDGNTAEIKGVTSLNSAPVMATDLRASAALILAGLIAKEKL